MEYYERNKRSGVSYKTFFYCLIAIVILTATMLLGDCIASCIIEKPTRDTVTVVKRDTITIEVHDTIPQIKKERIVKYVPMPDIKPVDESADADSTHNDSIAIVQREYSDDSTYTAWVSGLRYGVWPKLDSINVRRQIVTEHIKETITIRKKSSRWTIGAQAGIGYGFRYQGIEPYIGVGIGFRLYK